VECEELTGSGQFWEASLRRAQFLALTLFEIVLDGLYLLLTYGWFRLVEHFAGRFEDVSGYESWLLAITKAVLTFLPIMVVWWFVIIDFMGSMRRIWERRNG
jgi:hypothetical protein